MGEQEPRKTLEQELSYWKAHISVQDVLACELSYSLLYDNIHPDKVGQALSTVGLDTLPNRFFLIQVDDYLNHSSKLRITQEFFQKTVLVNMLRDYMTEHGIRGFAANLVGMDKIICFLCCEEKETENPPDDLLAVAEAFKERIRQRSAYTISICISEPCRRIIQYSEMYPRMDLALSKSYFSGKEFSILLKDVKSGPESRKQAVDLNVYYPEFLVSIVRHKREQFDEVLREILKKLLETQIQPRKAQLEIIRLLQRVSEYCLRCGMQETWVREFHEEIMNRILTCSFLADVRIYLGEYYERVTRELEEHSGAGEYAFKLLVEEYVAAHYHGAIRLGTLAAVMGFSEGHFTRTFRREFGMTFIRYLNEYRIEQSKKLLTETDISIEQIAYRVGINNYSYFCTCFKQTCGMSPGVYRRKAAADRRYGRDSAEP